MTIPHAHCTSIPVQLINTISLLISESMTRKYCRNGNIIERIAMTQRGVSLVCCECSGQSVKCFYGGQIHIPMQYSSNMTIKLVSLCTPDKTTSNESILTVPAPFFARNDVGFLLYFLHLTWTKSSLDQSKNKQHRRTLTTILTWPRIWLISCLCQCRATVSTVSTWMDIRCWTAPMCRFLNLGFSLWGSVRGWSQPSLTLLG